MAKFGLRVLVATTGAAMLCVAQPGAAYAWSYAGGSCSDADSDANFGTYYTLTGGYNRVDQFEYLLDHPSGLGNKNNVRIRHYQNVSGGFDTQKYAWTSGDNIPGHQLRTHTPSSLTRTPDGKWAHSQFKFDFDTSGPDDSCTADTNNFR